MDPKPVTPPSSGNIQITITYNFPPENNSQRRRSTSLPQEVAPEIQLKVSELKGVILDKLPPVHPPEEPHPRHHQVESGDKEKISRKKSEVAIRSQCSPEFPRKQTKEVRRWLSSPSLAPEEKNVVAKELCFYLQETEQTHQKAMQLLPHKFLVNFLRGGGEDKSLQQGSCFHTITVKNRRGGKQNIEFLPGETSQQYLTRLSKSIYENGFVQKLPPDEDIERDLDFLNGIMQAELQKIQQSDLTRILKKTREAVQKLAREEKEKELLKDLETFSIFVKQTTSRLRAAENASETAENEVAQFYKIAEKEKSSAEGLFPPNYSEEVHSILKFHFPAWPVMQMLNPSAGSPIEAVKSIWPELSHNASELGPASKKEEFPTCIGMHKCDTFEHCRASIRIEKRNKAQVVHKLCLDVVMHYIGEERTFEKIILGDVKIKVIYPVDTRHLDKKGDNLLKGVEIRVTEHSFIKEEDLTLDITRNEPLLEAFRKSLLKYRKAMEDTPRKGKIHMRTGSLLFPLKSGRTKK